MGATGAGARVVITPPPGWSFDEMGYMEVAKTIDFAAG